MLYLLSVPALADKNVHTDESEGVNFNVFCEDSLKQAQILNANQLWDGAAFCAKMDRKQDTNYLLILGQIRAMADMNMLTPVAKTDKKKLSEMYMTLFYQTGGSGFSEIYANRDDFANWYAKVQQWQPTLTNSYNPGWQYSVDFKKEDYLLLAECRKQIRLAQLSKVASRKQNSQYQKLSEELETLLSAYPNAYLPDSPMNAQYQRLFKQRDAISLKHIDKSAQACDLVKPFVYKPDPNANFKQIYTGFNAPENNEAVTFFKTAQEVQTSWLIDVIEQSKLEKMLNNIDFSEQMLVALNFGNRGDKISGNVYISDIEFTKEHKGYSISGLVGISEHPCLQIGKVYRPFALAVTKKPDFDFKKSSGYFMQNFPDECARSDKDK